MEFPGNKLIEHQKQFRRIVQKADNSYRRGDFESAIIWTQIAAHFAWERHPGCYFDLTLESILTQISNQIREKAALSNLGKRLLPSKTPGKLNVLHVISGCRGLGGHTLVITGWIKNTSKESVHNIVATSQYEPLPDELTSLAIQTGGLCPQLAQHASNVIDRSLLLRELKNQVDLVVIHAHPHDAVPNLAFGIKGGPPILFLNHADDVFWLGVSVSDMVLDLHPSGQSQTLNRRHARTSKILPIPLNQPPKAIGYEQARQKLGISPDTVVLLTVARECKYSPVGTHDFIAIHKKTVKRHSNVLLIAVGPENRGRWAAASIASEGKIKPVGGITWQELHSFYASADIFLDSFPTGTGTAFLEAAMRGIPTIGFQFKEAPSITECTDDVAFGDTKPFPASIEQYESLLDDMILKRQQFRQQAEDAKEQVVKHHCSPGWNRYLYEILGNLPSSHSIWLPEETDSLLEPVNTVIAEWDAAILGIETSQETYGRLMISYADQLKKADMLKEQASAFMNQFTKQPDVRRVKPFLYRCKKTILP